jgi:hypothetical protein
MPPPKMSAIQSEDSIIERAKRRRRKPAKLLSMDDAFDGKKKREEPVFGMREDGQFMFYAGKENAIYGATEAGKDMLLVETVAQTLDFGQSVCWIDFEEGDEIDIASRLKEMGASRDAVCDQYMFRFSTPEDVDAAQDSVQDALDHRCQLVIFNGLQSAYGLFGWELFDPNSPVMFRRALVTRLTKSDRCVITTDHMTKTSAESKSNGSRYAAGGIAKLNWINGAAYMLEAVDPIIRGAVGRSKIILTKDRPGFVKSECARIEREPTMMYAGTLIVKSTGDKEHGYSLRVDIKHPEPGSVVKDRLRAKREGTEYEDITREVIDKVLDIYQRIGKAGASKADIERAYKGNKGASQVRAAIQILVTNKCLVKAGRSGTSNIAPLRYAKDYDPDE